MAKAKRSDKKKKPRDGPKRPMNAYLLWMNSNRGELLAENPGISITELARRAGAMWRKPGTVDKARWEAQARAGKDEYLQRKLEAEAAAVKAGKKRLKRPPNAYLLWLNANREALKKENPGLSVTQLAKKAGEKWRKDANIDKEKWEEDARQRKEQYDQLRAQQGDDPDATGGRRVTRTSSSGEKRRRKSKPMERKRRRPTPQRRRSSAKSSGASKRRRKAPQRRRASGSSRSVASKRRRSKPAQRKRRKTPQAQRRRAGSSSAAASKRRRSKPAQRRR